MTVVLHSVRYSRGASPALVASATAYAHCLFAPIADSIGLTLAARPTSPMPLAPIARPPSPICPGTHTNRRFRSAAAVRGILSKGNLAVGPWPHYCAVELANPAGRATVFRLRRRRRCSHPEEKSAPISLSRARAGGSAAPSPSPTVAVPSVAAESPADDRADA